ncbi:hypothetical protein JOF48_003388 [Arthrobacter stackebrandtii]|uniref:Acetone carboxylase n=1 Tax=Arthrobacter stackebrandtii TaxID=272161 RepID=A0ABS4Z0T1_9MICC|nr:hypothetical protein [Arthrobacter stackebrandtii]MBP2414589.1 hypothetical protein [Arthrobacter stackebrandtii]PYH01694.1 hypothetical protein CVV67_04325 [Arthrobacter stackebrandtii]
MSIFDMLPGGGNPGAPQGPESPVCSRKGCRADATTQLLWNNPKIHTPDRRKIWLACDDHVAWLEDYLKGRSLWKETLPLDALPLNPEDPA